MFNISEGFIKGNCYFRGPFDKGRRYQKEGRIRSLKLDEEDMIIEGMVKGSRLYRVLAYFDDDGYVMDVECNCPAARQYWGYCKHMVAVLLEIMEWDQKGRFNEAKNRKASAELFDMFEHIDRMHERKAINLEVTYELNPRVNQYSQPYAAISMRIGEERLYIIKNIRKFLQSLDEYESIEFGKNFTFDPNIHSFSPEDTRLMDFLKEIHDTEKFMLSYGNNTSVFFRDKYLHMNRSLSRRFFDIIEDRKFRAVIGNYDIPGIQVRQEDIPVAFKLDKSKDDLLLKLETNDIPVPLTDDGRYIFMAGNIYKPSKEQLDRLIPFFGALYGKGKNSIRFVKEDRERFVSEILPHARKVGSVEVSNQVKSILVKEELNTEVYLERQGNGIGAKIKFIYGEYEINPVSSVESRHIQGERILLRDVEKERSIMDVFINHQFTVQPKGVHLEDEEKIFEFIYRGLPQLQRLADVFYSEDFKAFTLRNRTSYSGGIRLNQDTDLLEFHFTIDDVDGEELGKVFRALREKKRYYRLKDGSFLPLDNSELVDIANLIENLDVAGKNLENEIVEISKYRAPFLDQKLKESGIKGIRRNHAFRELVESIREPGDLDIIEPESLKNILRDYQKYGFQWLKTLSVCGMGGVLADDMGLGKTLQIIALLLSEKEENGTKPSLVVAPTSLIYNWEAEVKKFAPQLKTLVISGTREERLEQIKNIEQADVVITSYPLIRRDGESYGDTYFRYCILDEAQHIKNPDSQGAKAVKTIKAEGRFALTGTPMENSLTELWSIFDFVLPGYLFSHGRFMRQYESPIVRAQDADASKELSRLIRPFILRRLKKDVLQELPDKIEHQLMVELSGEQKKVYLAYLQQIRGEIEEEINEKGFERSHIKILSGLTRLRQICCHPSTFLENFKGDSAKMQLLGEMIQESMDGGHRILLFSQFTSMLAIIRDYLEKNDIEYLYLDGATPVEERGRLVKAFNGGQGVVFLISLKAGGMGLNLTGADTVIHFDPWWNPAVEDQATDRAYRIGQDKVVHVMKLVTKGTIEEKIVALQNRKKELINTVIQPGQTLLSKLTEAELKELFNP